MVKISKQLPTIGAVALAAILVVLQIDDNLDSESKTMLENSTTSDISSSWFYMMGFGASKDQDPLYTGRERYISYIHAKALTVRTRSEFDYIDVLGARSLQNTEGAIYCEFYEENCIGEILNNRKIIQSELEKHSLLVSRYLKFASMRNYKTMIVPSMDSIYPRFQYLIDGSRLIGLKAIDAALNGDHMAAAELLLSNEITIREKLAESDDLLFTLILLFMFSENIDKTALVNVISDVSSGEIAPLSPQEKNFDQEVAREFELGNSTINSIYQNQKHDSIGYHIVRPILYTFVKPNMSANLIRMAYEHELRLSNMSHTEFAVATLKPRVKHSSISNYIRNIGGTYMSDTSKIDLGIYFARMYDMDAKIALYNHIFKQSNLSLVQLSDSFVNPYYGEVGHSYVSENAICFKGPYDNTRGRMCVFVINENSDVLNYAETTPY